MIFKVPSFYDTRIVGGKTKLPKGSGGTGGERQGSWLAASLCLAAHVIPLLLSA